MKETTAWICFVALLVLLILGCVFLYSWNTQRVTELMIKDGYTWHEQRFGGWEKIPK